VADPSAGEARLTDKIIKGFFFKTSLLYSRVSPYSIILFLSLSFSLTLSSCFFLSLSQSLFLQLHLTEVSAVLSLPRPVEFALDESKNDRPEYACVMFDLSRRKVFSSFDRSRPVETRRSTRRIFSNRLRLPSGLVCFAGGHAKQCCPLSVLI
jgi:hypothetical protein